MVVDGVVDGFLKSGEAVDIYEVPWEPTLPSFLRVMGPHTLRA